MKLIETRRARREEHHLACARIAPGPLDRPVERPADLARNGFPPRIEELRKRLIGRATDAPEVIESRIAKAEFELGFAEKFDVVVINDELEKAKADALATIQNFLNA